MLRLIEGWDEVPGNNQGFTDTFTYGPWSAGNREGYGSNFWVPNKDSGSLYGRGGTSATGSFFVEGGAHNWESIDFGASIDTIFIGFAYYGRNGGWTQGAGVFSLRDETGRWSLSLSHDGATGLWVVKNHVGWPRDYTTVQRQFISTQSTGLSAWHYIEFAARVHPTAGWIEMRQDGQSMGGYYGGIVPSPGMGLENIPLSQTNGSMPAGTYRVGLTFTNAAGETTIGPIGTITIAANSGISVGRLSGSTQYGFASYSQMFGWGGYLDLPFGASGYNVYVSQPGGTTVYKQNGSPITGDGYSITTVPPTTNAQPPATNTTTSATGRSNANGNTMGAQYSSGVRQLYLGAPSADGEGFAIDDLYVCDNVIQSANQPNNDFLGDVVVARLVPNAAGTHTDFALGGNATSAQQTLAVQPVQVDAGYVSAQNVNNEETVRFTTLPSNTVSVFGVQAQIILRKTDVGPRQVGMVIRYSAVNFEITIAQTSPQTIYKMIWQIIETRQDTQPFAIADVNAIEIGAEITA